MTVPPSGPLDPRHDPPFRPRADDHFVEPFFAALGQVPPETEGRGRSRRRALLAGVALLVSLVLLALAVL